MIRRLIIAAVNLHDSAALSQAPVLPGSPSDFGDLIAAETEKWGKVVKFAGIKPD